MSQFKNEFSSFDPVTTELLKPELICLFEDILNKGVCLRVKVTGRSMIPFLYGGEFVTIKKVPVTYLVRGDLIFFRNSEGLPILHRLIQKQKQPDGKTFFLTKGDALKSFDAPVPGENIMGKVIRIAKEGRNNHEKTINMESYWWKFRNYKTGMMHLMRQSIVKHIQLTMNALSM